MATAFAYLDISDPLVAWLIYRGEMVSCTQAHASALSSWAAGYLRGVAQDGTARARYTAELALEAVREAHYPDVVSRLKGFYVFPDETSAQLASQRWLGGAFRQDLLAEVALRPGTRTSMHDAEWITNVLDSGDESGWHRYLEGKPYGQEPIWELLVDGRACVLGTRLREQAYDVVRATWPQSLALLELARVGVELDSDLGLITAMVLRGDQLEVKYVMNFVDATNQAFLDRFAAFDGPKNTNDLNASSELVVPDLRDREFSL